MKRKLLFVIPGLDAGGAEKSLVNLLNEMDGSRFSIDLFMFSHEGLFISQVPEWVRILPRNADLLEFQKPLHESLLTFLKKGKFALAQDRLLFYLKNRFMKIKGVAEQYSWKNLCSACESLPVQYDAAIGFLEKTANYFVVDCVCAEKKLGFIHNDYTKLGLDHNFDKPYFEKLTTLATVSEECEGVLNKVFPHLSGKIKLMNNIVSSKLIRSLAEEKNVPLDANAIVSVGRLHPQKGFDLAVEAGSVLKEKGVDFHWYIIGEGRERRYLEHMITERKLGRHFTLLGLKENPYPYIREAKVFVQPSRYEGKSIAVDEAKILAKPIVLTNFTTAKDQIEHDVNGLIVAMTAEAIAAGVLRYFEDSSFTNRIIAKLHAQHYSTEHQIDTFYKLISKSN